jgi:hypothetical protein
MKRLRWLAVPVLLFGLLGCPAPGTTVDAPMEWDRVPVSIQGRLAEDEPGEGLTQAPIVGEAEVVHLYPDVRFSRDDIRFADVVPDSDPLLLRIWFTEEGAERVAEVTAEYPGRRFALLVNGHVVSAPQIVQPLQPRPEVPVGVEVRLPEADAERLASAVAQTWPAEQAPSAEGEAPVQEDAPAAEGAGAGEAAGQTTPGQAPN